MVRPRFILFFLSVLLLSSCGERGKWLKQRHSDFDGGEIAIPESEMSLPIRLPLSEIQTVLNQKIPNTLVQDKPIKGNLKVTIERAGSVALAGENQSLYWSVPLTVEVKHNLMGTVTKFKLMPKFVSALSLKDDYSMQPSTSLQNVVWMNKAVVKVLGLELDITPFVDDLIRDESSRITQLIDEQLTNLDLQKILKKTWSKLSNPIRINRQVQPVYLTIDARELRLHGFEFIDNDLAIDLSVVGTLNNVFDSAANARVDVPFPPLVIDKTGKGQTALYLPVVIDYNRVNAKLKEHIFGLQFTVEDQDLSLDSVNLTSVDSFLLITAIISGDVDMEIEVLGRPYFSASTRELSVEGFDFNVTNTSTSLLRAGDYFFHDEIIDEILSKLKIPIGAYIDTIPQLIYSGVERGRSGKNINIETELDSIDFHQFRVRYNDMAMVLFATGKVGLHIEKLKAPVKK